jgi:transcriptional regulator with XRE-family HTH domain
MERKVSLADAAEKIGISFQQLRKYETGRNTMSVTAMKHIAAALNIEACEICGCCD